MNIYERLSLIQKELKAPKNQFNSFGKYKYRSCEDILEEVKKHLADCILTISDEVVLIGSRFYIKATAKLFNADQSLEVSAYAREEEVKKGMDASQISGAASSYARKYALNGLFLIDDTKDADSTNQHGKDTPEQSAQVKKAVADDVPDIPGPKDDAETIAFLRMTTELQIETLEGMSHDKNHTAKKALPDFTAGERLRYFKFLREM